MIKKNNLSQGDQKTWENYIKDPSDIFDKDISVSKNNLIKKQYKFDLHGFTLENANEKVKEILLEVLKSDDRVLQDPAPFVSISEHADSSINYAVRPWVKASNYWDVYFDTHESVKRAFDEKGISIPFPQRDLHIVSGLEK